MTTISIKLYRALHKSIRRYASAEIPLVGAPGFPFPLSASPTTALRKAFRSEGHHTGLDEGFRLLRALGSQLTFLHDSGEDIRQMLQFWQHALYGGYFAASTAAATEQLSNQLFLMLKRQQAEQQLAIDLEEDSQTGPQELVIEADRLLSDLASTASKDNESLFQASSAAGHRDEEDVLHQQLTRISQVVFQEARLKHHPLEWVYDGLSPIMLPMVLSTRKGVPLMLAVVYSAVARRLGLEAVPVRSVGAEGVQAEDTSSPPPDVLARQAGRASTTAPAPPTWLVAARTAAGPMLYVDVTRKGEVLLQEQCVMKYPSVPTRIPNTREVVSVAAADMARTVLTAHQRRGESDATAQWLYMALALDPYAPEWDHFLGGQH